MRKMALKSIEGYPFQFTRRWFANRNQPSFREFIYPVWKDKPLTYLELGVFEGMSMVWMMQYIVTHPESRAVGIDPWLMTRKLDGARMEEVRTRACLNTHPYRERCSLIRGNSAEVLRRMVGRKGYKGIQKNSVDLCMIDGNHNSLAVCDDAQLCYKLVKPGGWLLFDDIENDHKKTDHVKDGIDLFLMEYGGKVDVVWKHRYMICYAKR